MSSDDSSVWRRHACVLGIVLLIVTVLASMLSETGVMAATSTVDMVESHPDVIQRTGTDTSDHHEVPNVHWIWILPFALLLGSIAVVPLINMHFWEHRYPWFAIVLGLITAVYYLCFFTQDLAASRQAWFHEMQEYISFISLLGSLYVVSGGIMIQISRRGRPLTNTLILLVGAIIANVVGTTGAAMLLIRPYIRINRDHIKPYHIVFFIFTVANCGGCLTPIGDPPLFMGYLKGVPFFWVLQELWPMWAVCVALLLVVFFIVDSIATRKHQADPDGREEPESAAGRRVEIYGTQNFLFIGLILLGVFRPSIFEVWASEQKYLLPLSREALMTIAAIISKITTKPFIYERNEFTYGPIKEVAILFVGIFSTMVPALNYLNRHSDQMPLQTAGQYYFTTGILSSMLDNAPTYLVFLETKRGSIVKQYSAEMTTIRFAVDSMTDGRQVDRQQLRNKYINTRLRTEGQSDDAYTTQVDLAVEQIEIAIHALQTHHRTKIATGQITDDQLNIAFLFGHSVVGLFAVAISVGAVFFGAATYIGNGPNFMVKSIAESSGIAMPSFFGYLVRYSLPVLLPILLVIWFFFFRG